MSTIRVRKGERGVIALEYILIVAIVAMALIGAFRLWGEKASEAVKKSGTNPAGGYDTDTGIGGALEAP